MSILSSLFSGISGLNAYGTAMSVVGNNIANVNTIGFKEGRAEFSDILSQSLSGAMSSSQIGRGIQISTIQPLLEQGTFQTTSSPTDLAIDGAGFFVLKDNTGVYYTRAGNFSLNKEAKLSNPGGFIVQGWSLDSVGNPVGSLTDMDLAAISSAPQTTSKVTMALNLDANADFKGTVDSLSNTTDISNVTVTSGKFPPLGSYTFTVAPRTAAAITQTGSNDATFTFSSTDTLKINGRSISLAGVSNIADLVSTINSALATAPAIAITASNSGNRLVLTATADGTDIVVNTSGVSGGDIGWTADDIADSALLGGSLAVSGAQTIAATNIGTHGGTLTNWRDSGLSITMNASNYTVAGSTATMTLSGFDSGNPATTSNFSSSLAVYDSLGNGHTVTVYFRKDAEDLTLGNTWQWFALVDGGEIVGGTAGTPVQTASGTLRFTTEGALDMETANPSVFNFSGGATQDQEITLDFGNSITTDGDSNGLDGTTQFAGSSETLFQNQDGNASGSLKNISIDPQGVISGLFTNGQSKDIARIALAKFPNAAGLKSVGGNLLMETYQSGQPLLGPAGAGGMGTIASNSLEMSNVDLATQFVEMIKLQQGFQANSRVITTTDQMMDELMNIKR